MVNSGKKYGGYHGEGIGASIRIDAMALKSFELVGSKHQRIGEVYKDVDAFTGRGMFC